MPITEEQFNSYLAFTRMPAKGKTTLACKMVLVDGLPRAEVVKKTNISNSVLSRGLRRLQAAVDLGKKCPHCGKDL